MHYTSVGHVLWPVHNSPYANTFAGIMTVRIVVEDCTVDWRYPVQPGFEPFQEDFIVGCTGLDDAKAAFEYFGGPGHKFVENTLVGTINWTGIQRLEGGLYQYFSAERKDLDDEAKRLLDTYEATQWPGCKIFLITSLSQKHVTIAKIMDEAKALTLPSVEIPHALQIRCTSCKKEKPNLRAKKLGWVRVQHENKAPIWFCGSCNKV